MNVTRGDARYPPGEKSTSPVFFPSSTPKHADSIPSACGLVLVYAAMRDREGRDAGFLSPTSREGCIRGGSVHAVCDVMPSRAALLVDGVRVFSIILLRFRGLVVFRLACEETVLAFSLMRAF